MQLKFWMLFVAVVAVGESAYSATRGESANASKKTPNIVLFVTDDLGYADLGVTGGKEIPTPNIDSIAKQGVRFANAYALPLCAPSRAALLSGRYPQRWGQDSNGHDPEYGLPVSERSLAEALKSQGYATALVGKWHSGYSPEHLPNSRGFDEFYGFLSNGHVQIQAEYAEEGDAATLTKLPTKARQEVSAAPADSWDRLFINGIFRNREPIVEKEYLTDAYGRESVEFIDKHKDKPFFLEVAFNAMGLPLDAKAKYLKRFEHIEENTRRIYAAQLSAIDDNVGRVLAALNEHGLDDNTIVIFQNDNGGTPIRSSNAPFRGYKGEVWEGGVHVPLLIRWDGHLPAGKVYDSPVSIIDIFPTVLAATRGDPNAGKPLDGVNLLPYLTDPSFAGKTPHEALFWRFGGKLVVRNGRWKLLKEQGPSVALYDLQTDAQEKHNVADEHPEIVAKLEQQLYDWASELEPARWDQQRPASPGAQGGGAGSAYRRPGEQRSPEVTQWFAEALGGNGISPRRPAQQAKSN